MDGGGGGARPAGDKRRSRRGAPGMIGSAGGALCAARRWMQSPKNHPGVQLGSVRRFGSDGTGREGWHSLPVRPLASVC